MATIIFDFDHTLLDSRELTKAIHEMFVKSGIPDATIHKIQLEQRSKNHDNPDPVKQIQMFENLGYTIDPKYVDDLFYLNLEKNLKGPVKETLSKLKNKGHKLMLLTKGVEYFQKYKIRQCGIEDFFNSHIYICDNKKEELLKNIPAKGRTYFVDDHADEIEAVIKKYPEMNFVYVKGPKTSHGRFLKHKKIPTIENISELPKIIK